MKLPAELAIALRVISQIIIIIIICCWETPNTVAAKAFATIVRRFRSNYKSRFPQLIPDKFVQYNSSCTHPLPYHCYKQTKESLVTSPTPQCECVCDKKQPTIGYVNHTWSCVRDDVAHRLCSIRCFGEDENGMHLLKINSSEYITLWTNVHGQRCRVDWSNSGILQCNNTIMSIKSPPDIRISPSNGRYWLQVHTITEEVEGRIMKIGIRCDDGSPPTNHCLMLKVAGEINCPIRTLPVRAILSPTTTLTPTTTSIPSVVKIRKQTTSQEPTVAPSTPADHSVGGRTVPVEPIAGGVAAAVIVIALLAVILLCRRKRQKHFRTNTRCITEASSYDGVRERVVCQQLPETFTTTQGQIGFYQELNLLRDPTYSKLCPSNQTADNQDIVPVSSTYYESLREKESFQDVEERHLDTAVLQGDQEYEFIDTNRKADQVEYENVDRL